MPTRSELMYLAAGIAIGGAVGANWEKIRPLLESFLGPAAAGFQDAVGDLLGPKPAAATAASAPVPPPPPPPTANAKPARRSARTARTCAAPVAAH